MGDVPPDSSACRDLLERQGRALTELVRSVPRGIAAGSSQVLVLGAGYDSLTYRLASEFPDVGFFEIDHPATARLKARGIEQLGERGNLHLLAEDLGETKLADVLGANDSWNRTATSVIVAEGLLMCLPPPAPSELFGQCAQITGVGSRVVFTCVGTAADGRPDVGRWTSLVLCILRVSGEPWLWSIRPDELGGFLEETGWANAPDLVGPRDRHGVEHFGSAIK